MVTIKLQKGWGRGEMKSKVVTCLHMLGNEGGGGEGGREGGGEGGRERLRVRGG